jgi:phospholipid/cholesterol/gamma-HCH transport system substrate-binding protein
METRKQLLMTGLFLVIGTLIVLVTILMLGGDKKLFQTTAHLAVEFESVQGLGQGAVVSLSGLQIGNVAKIDFDPKKGKVQVTLRIADEHLNKLTAGSQAEIRTQGALGDKYIYITPGQPGAPPLSDGATLQSAKSADIMAILSEKGNETERVFEIIKELHLLTKSINDENRVMKIMKNLEAGSASFNRVSLQAESSMQKFDRVITHLEKGEGTLGALIKDPTVHDQLKSLLGGSQRKTQIKDMLRHSVER